MSDRTPRTVRHCWAERPEPQPDLPRKLNKRGAARRRSVMAFLRYHGVVTLAEMDRRFGQAVAVCTLATLWEMGKIDVLDFDRFRVRQKGATR